MEEEYHSVKSFPRLYVSGVEVLIWWNGFRIFKYKPIQAGIQCIPSKQKQNLKTEAIESNIYEMTLKATKNIQK